jgi:hypothetical protein
LRRQKWKFYQRPKRMELVGNYLSILENYTWGDSTSDKGGRKDNRTKVFKWRRPTCTHGKEDAWNRSPTRLWGACTIQNKCNTNRFLNKQIMFNKKKFSVGRDFPHLSRPAPGPTQPPVQWVPGLSRG